MVRFEYEWGSGNADDYKPRPCAIIIRGNGPRVFYFPISHEPPREDDVALAIPPEARAAAGLDGFPQWVVVSRCNRADWPDGVRNIPGRASPIYGTLPPGFLRQFRSAVAEVARRQLMRGWDRAPDKAG
ncbi:hypothetical protein [Roseomonas sp. AR75]|uniref:hypothetical protein n=1 Tax=Roseomonas sp. AR75 TaxID=2562311 RepID=UPI0010BFB507|nr:hypothetical protein [Roseomonas sp. AR75]